MRATTPQPKPRLSGEAIVSAAIRFPLLEPGDEPMVDLAFDASFARRAPTRNTASKSTARSQSCGVDPLQRRPARPVEIDGLTAQRPLQGVEMPVPPGREIGQVTAFGQDMGEDEPAAGVIVEDLEAHHGVGP